MERRIVSLGRSSLVISLPKHWLTLNELKKGDVVSLGVQRDRSLVVFPGAERKMEPQEMTLHIEPNETDSLIVRKLIGCYLNGYSGIKVLSKGVFSVAKRNAVRNISRTLYMRVMASDAKSMYIQTLIDESKASLEPAIERMHLISLSMCRDALNSLKNRDSLLAKAVFSLDDDVDHFFFFVLRLLRDASRDPNLANILDIDPLDCMDYQTLVYTVEHIADYSADIAGHIIMLEGSRQQVPDDILALMFRSGTEAVDLYDKAVNTFYTKDVPSSIEILERQKEIAEFDREIASKAFMSKHKNAELICAICSIRDDIKKIAEFAADIAETAINRAYKIPT
jgi:phosphate uptake regulator